MKSVVGIEWSNKKTNWIPMKMLLIERTAVHKNDDDGVPCVYAYTVSKYGIRKSVYDPVINYWMIL